MKNKEIAPKLSLEERNSKVVPSSAQGRTLLPLPCLSPNVKGCELQDKKYVVPSLQGGQGHTLLVACLPTVLVGMASHTLLFLCFPEVLCFPLMLVWQHFIPKYETCLAACFLVVCAQRIKNGLAGSLHDL